MSRILKTTRLITIPDHIIFSSRICHFSPFKIQKIKEIVINRVMIKKF